MSLSQVRKLNAAVAICRYFPVINACTYDFRIFGPVSPVLSSLSLYDKRPGRVLPYSLGVGVPAVFAKVLPFTSKSKFCKFCDAISEYPFNFLQVGTSFVRLAIPLNRTL